jgi:hypothetical protein
VNGFQAWSFAFGKTPAAIAAMRQLLLFLRPSFCVRGYYRFASTLPPDPLDTFPPAFYNSCNPGAANAESGLETQRRGFMEK